MATKTFVPKENEIERNWYIVDADNQVLGRLASQVATVIRGKHKPQFSPHLDAGDYVIVINAAKIRVTGSKDVQKRYFRHSRYPGGIRSLTFNQLLERNPERIIHEAVRGMLPKNALGRRMLKKLRVFAGPDHPHSAQQPAKLEIAN